MADQPPPVAAELPGLYSLAAGALRQSADELDAIAEGPFLNDPRRDDFRREAVRRSYLADRIDAGDQLAKILRSLPTTIDGVPIVPGMTVYGCGGRQDRVLSISDGFGHPGPGVWTRDGMERPFYSTAAAAVADHLNAPAPAAHP